MSIDAREPLDLVAEEEQALREVARLMLSWSARLGEDSRVSLAFERAAAYFLLTAPR
jgi:hypothetical protein